MPHGDLSDGVAVSLLALGAHLVFKPTLALGIIKPIVTASSPPEVALAYNFLGGIFILLGLTLFNVRWNSVHKLVALGFASNGIFFTYAGYTLAGGFHVFANPFFLYGLVLFLAGYHVAFRANKTYKEL